MTERDRRRIEAIAAERAGGTANDGYRIGPDDLLDIRIPDLLDPLSAPPPRAIVAAAAPIPLAQAPVFQQGVRVGADGDVDLPQLGRIRAGGLSTNALADAIKSRLQSGGILRRPEVSVQVAEYRSRVVGVVGSVERPGLYPLTRPGATLADMIWAAGGPSQAAGRAVAFLPASPSQQAVPQLDQLARGEPVRIDLETLLHATGEEARLLNPPVRPGDVINVSPAGSVQVDGWVGKPGAYPVTRSLTLSGAVAAAGGPLFPADRQHAEVKRVLASGEHRLVTVDLERVARGESPDLPIADGDVVHLPASFARLVPYGVWQLVITVFRVGGSLAVL
jgi:polysaccharide export outer membrane protein